MGALLTAACAPAAAPAPATSTGAQPAQSAAAPALTPPPVAKSDLKRADLLVETDKLATMLNEKNLRIVDLRPAAKYRESHVPGTIHLNANDLDAQTNGVQNLGAPAKVADVLGDLGIGDGSNVVLYDDQRTLFAARVFWVLDYLGHQEVTVLNGGFPKWQTEKR